MLDNHDTEYKIPESFLVAPFSTKRTTFKKLDMVDFDDILSKELFYFDMLHLVSNQLSKDPPWENSEITVKAVIQQWKMLEPDLQISYAKRKPNLEVESVSIQSISLFLLALFWANNTPIKSLNVKEMMVSELKLKPVNCEERLLFILNKPTGYHSFIQLQQLFAELEKNFYKTLAIQRLKQKKEITAYE
ncbi:YpoC family protein [Metabacillus sp. FJAT-53654]|uniref:YpoC family protein n=1 Tax=Metabacillus rhizosphaerae TaxID=3117747 RepID=A0ABZ2N0U3_9BACI